MKRFQSQLLIVFFLSLGLGLSLCLAPPAQALFEFGFGFGPVAFDDDLDAVDTDYGTSVEATFGSGSFRLMVAAQESSHDQGDYQAVMIGPAWILDTAGFSSRIYALLSDHEFENVDGTGVTLGGGVGWPVFPSASLGFDYRLSRWEGDGADVGTGTLQLLFRIGF